MTRNDKILPDCRPSHLEYAFISKTAYIKGPDDALVEGKEFQTEIGGKWFIFRVHDYDSGYFGVVFRCDSSKQFVIAHRGTNDLYDILEDLKGIFLNKYSPQKEDAFKLVTFVIDLIREDNSKYCDYTLSFTGHSLGGFLAEMCVFYAKTVLHFEGTSAVSFDSPGSKQSMQALHSQLLNSCSTDDKPLQQLETDWHKKLDITCYLCYPNAVNACNDHVGTVYTINVNVTGGMFASLPGIRLLNSHRMDGILQWFRETCVERNPENQRLYMADWPKGYKQLKIFYKHAVLKDKSYNIEQDLLVSEIHPIPSSAISAKDNYLSLRDLPTGGNGNGSTPNLTQEAEDHSGHLDSWFREQKKKIKLRFYGNFKVLEIDSSFRILPLHHFSPPMQSFLLEFYEKRTKLLDEVGKNKFLIKISSDAHSHNSGENDTLHQSTGPAAWKVLGIPEDIQKSLMSYEIRVNSIDIQEVICGREEENVLEFRKKISTWLAHFGCSVEHLLPKSLIHAYKLKFIRTFRNSSGSQK